MTSRLQELLRQKALVEEQAAWLEREIARERAAAAPAADPAPAMAPAPAAGSPAAPAGDDKDASAIIERYRGGEQTNRRRIKLGCMLYTLAAVVLALLPFLFIYLYFRRR